MRRCCARQRAFTLVELLVVIAIIGILVALLLPAVQAAREAGRRSQCGSQLKQLAIAVHNFHSAEKRFPPGGKGYGWCSSTAGGTGDTVIQNMSGWVYLLPYFEQSTIYNQLDLKDAFSQQNTGYCCGFIGNANGTLAGNPATNVNGGLMSVQLAMFNCPSDQGNRIENPSTPYGPGGNRTGALINYDFIASRNDSGLGANGCNYWKRVSLVNKYPFGENSTTTFASITDGSSNTFMIGESTVAVANGEANAWGYRGWVMTGVDPVGGINIWNLLPSGQRERGNLSSWGQAGSLHPGGCLFAYCDGSVRFVSDMTSSIPLQQTSQMSDGKSPTVD